ncbi:MAG TPA: SDR family oxidoreductase, partial [Acidimicrobiia bacterium]|nr:SDR family oxidoreductase [Acidimicrobiia bacterium]
VVGGATGMGAATAELVQDLGAEVIVMDFAPVTLDGAKAINLDLRDKASIETALDECGGPIHALFACAGVADGTAGIEKINFIGHRHLIDRAIAQGYLGRGSAIGFISSTAGLGWRKHLDEVKGYLDAAPDFDSAVAWIEANPDKASYTWSKQSINVYVQSRALELLKQGIRVNAILPGPTDTPLARANAETWLGFGTDYRGDAGIEASRPDEQAGPLVFLCSDAASHVSGEILIVDAGFTGSGITGAYETAAMAVEFMENM